MSQFEPFLKANPRTRQALNSGGGAQFLKRYSPKPDCPIIVVSWYMAAEYCNWLSAQEGIPPDQWCYEPNTSPALALLARTVGFMAGPSRQGPLLAAYALARGRTVSAEYDAGMKLKPDYLHRTGYRLPTEAEWEYACRAGAATSRYYGETVELLEKYARYNANSADHTWPVGALKPNDLGLFDMYGNVFSWCLDEFANYPKSRNGEPIEDKENADDMKGISSTDSRLLRGGSFGDLPVNVRSASRNRYVPASRNNYVGFRPARTFIFP